MFIILYLLLLFFVPIHGYYTFVHPTKSGGTAAEEYFAAHYPRRIRGRGHHGVCADAENPIIILREPMDRLKSIFLYWKAGADAGKHKVQDGWVHRLENMTISSLISMLAQSDDHLEFSDLLYKKGLISKMHFRQQVCMIRVICNNRMSHSP